MTNDDHLNSIFLRVFENDIAGLRSVINDRILEMAKGGTGTSEVPLGFDPSLPNINLAELMLGGESKLFMNE